MKRIKAKTKAGCCFFFVAGSIAQLFGTFTTIVYFQMRYKLIRRSCHAFKNSTILTIVGLL